MESDVDKADCFQYNELNNEKNDTCMFKDGEKNKCVKLAFKYLLEQYPEINNNESKKYLRLSYAKKVNADNYLIEKCIKESGLLKKDMLDRKRKEIANERGIEKDRKIKELDDYYIKEIYNIGNECKNKFVNGDNKTNAWDIGYSIVNGLTTDYRIILSEYHCDPIDYSKTKNIIKHPEYHNDGWSL